MFKSTAQAKTAADNARTGFRQAKEAGDRHRMAQEQKKHTEAINFLRENGW